MRGMAVLEAVWVRRANSLAIYLLALVIAASIALVLAAKPAHARTFTVNSTADAGDATPDGIDHLHSQGGHPGGQLRLRRRYHRLQHPR